MKALPPSLRPIPLRVRPAPFEPAYGLLGRLAVRHGYSTSRAFVADMAFGIADFVHELECGRRLAELACLAGLAEATLAASTMVTDQAGICGSERSKSMWRRTTARSVLPDASVRAAYALTLRRGTGRSPAGPTGGSGGI